MGRWHCHTAPVHIDPGSINVDGSGEFAIAGDNVPDRPANHILPGFCQVKIDLNLVPEFDLFPERTLFPEKDRTYPVLFEFFFSDTMLYEEAHSDKCTQVIILGMKHMEIRVQVGPADIYAFLILHPGRYITAHSIGEPSCLSQTQILRHACHS